MNLSISLSIKSLLSFSIHLIQKLYCFSDVLFLYFEYLLVLQITVQVWTCTGMFVWRYAGGCDPPITYHYILQADNHIPHSLLHTHPHTQTSTRNHTLYTPGLYFTHLSRFSQKQTIRAAKRKKKNGFMFLWTERWVRLCTDDIQQGNRNRV